MTSIAVTTPNGTVGRHLVGHLVRAGVRPRVLTRAPERLNRGVSGLVDARAVDLTDAASLAAGLVGVDVLYLVVPGGAAGPDPLLVYTRVAAAVARALPTPTPRVVLQSSVGAEQRHGAGEIDGLAHVEQTLDAIDGIDVTHLRCGYFMTNLLLDPTWRETGVLETLTDQRLPFVAPDDIAVVAATLLLNRDWHGRRVQAVHGPADLTFAEVAEVLSRQTGRAVRAERIDDDTRRAQLRAAGMGEAQVEAVVEMTTGLRDGFVPEQPRDAVTTTATTLEQWALSALRPSAG